MTRAAALKKIIRARAAKTGERYTTARRHVLNELQHTRTSPSDTSHPGTSHVAPSHPGTSHVAPSHPRTPARPASVSPRGSVSDATAIEKTGQGLAHWFDVLDRFGAVEKGHTAAARHLHEAHGVPGWHAQGITVAYERARGVRTLNQRGDGAYEVSISKVVAGSTADVIKAFTKAGRRRWVAGVDTKLVGALASALDSGNSKGANSKDANSKEAGSKGANSKSAGAKGFVVRADGQGRFRYKWDGTTVQFYLLPKAGGRLSVVVTNTRLPRAAMVEERRRQWRTALNALAQRFAQ